MDQKVALVSCDTYTEDTLSASLERAWELSGGVDVQGKRVLLKPNILRDALPEKAVCTHPEFLRAVIRLVKARGAAEIKVGDSPGHQKPGFSAKLSGLSQVALEEGVQWVNFASERMALPVEGGRAVKEFKVTKVLSDVDLVISLPKLKTHQLMYFTGAVKNIFGVIPGVLKSPYHLLFPNREGFAAMLVDLFTAVKPDFAIMDGIIGMEGPGPGSGTPRTIGVILASRNLPALDMVASSIIGYDPMDIPTNREAASRGLCPDSLEKIQVLGESISSVRIDDFKLIKKTRHGNLLRDIASPGLVKRFRDAFGQKPVFLKGSCILCGECIKICPAKALKFEGKRRHVSIDYKTCIRCFCCHEVCPEKAIEIKRKIVL